MIDPHDSFFRDLVEKSGSPIAAYGRDGQFVYANEAYATMLGMTAEELVDTPVWEVNLAVDRDQFDSYWCSFDPGETRTDLTVHQRSDGEELHVEVSTTRRDIDGTTYHFGSIRDVSERIRRERTLETLHSATRRLMEATSRERISEIAFDTAREVIGHDNCGVWFYDEPDAVLRATVTGDDELHTRVLGPDSFLWFSFQRGEPTRFDHVQSRTHPEWDGDHETLRETGIKAVLDIPLGDHGVFALVSYEDDEIPDPTESFATILAANTKTALDRAAREETLREQRKELQRQNEQLEQFASVLSHDLRNPLNIAQGNLDLAEEAGVNDRLPAVEDALIRMETMIEDLLTLARSGRRVGETTTVGAGDVAKRAWKTVEGDESSLDVGTGVGTVDADPHRLRQLFENLFRNAIEHGSTSPHSASSREDAVERGGAEVTVTVGALSGTAGFYVEDDGPGLDDADRNRLFEYGYSASGGTGLGLAIVKNIVDAHEWSIRAVESDSGARFEIRTLDDGGVRADGAAVESE